MMWNRIIWLFILFLMGKHICFPSSPRYLELADSADYYISHENWSKAEITILEAIRLEPANFTNSLLLANLGMVQTRKGDHLKALESLSLGLNIAPSSTVLLNNRAHTFLLLDSIDKAITDLDRSLSIDSIQEWTLQTRAFIYLHSNQLEEAFKSFNKIKSFSPDNPVVYSGLAVIEKLNGNLPESIKNYETALRLNPDDEEIREGYIYLLIKTDEYSKARNEIKEALEKFPENPMFYLLRGYLHKLNYRLEEAEADKKIALSKGLDPIIVNSFIP